MVTNINLYLVFNIQKNEIHLPLFSQQVLQETPPVIKEDDSVSLVLRSEKILENLVIRVQDIEFSFSGPKKVDTLYEYSFPNNRNSRPFLNHFGRSNLCVSVKESNIEVSFYTSIEILAKYDNSIRAEKMLDYLENKMEDIVRACFSITHKTAGASPIPSTSVHAHTLMQEIREGLQTFSVYRRHFINRKRSRIIPENKIEEWQSARITENSIHWLLNNLDKLETNSSPSPSNVVIRGQRFSVSQIDSELLVENTNVYENQVIMGYLESILNTLIKIEYEYSELEKTLPEKELQSNIPSGYQSFSHMREKFGRRYYAKLLNESRSLQEDCRKSIAFCNQYIPVKEVVRETPKITDGFNSYVHYREIFNKITNWYRVGKLTALGDRFLYSLRTLDKLYEFYSMFQLIEAIEDCGFQMIQSLKENEPSVSNGAKWEINPHDLYIFIDKNNTQLRLRYEPTISSTSTQKNDLIYIFSDEDGGRGYITPDFLLEVHSQGHTSYAIFDSKYTKYENARGNYLSKLAMKYIHSIGSKKGGYSPIKAMIILYSGSISKSGKNNFYYYRKDRNIFSNSPALPVLGAVRVSPAIDKIEIRQTKNVNLAVFLNRLLDILKSNPF